jgi:hypothetical protein
VGCGAAWHDGQPDDAPDPVLPEGMTAEKLRYIADWLDIYDRMAVRYIEAIVASGGAAPAEGERAQMVVRSKEVQDDLRRWAAHIDGPVT